MAAIKMPASLFSRACSEQCQTSHEADFVAALLQQRCAPPGRGHRILLRELTPVQWHFLAGVGAVVLTSFCLPSIKYSPLLHVLQPTAPLASLRCAMSRPAQVSAELVTSTLSYDEYLYMDAGCMLRDLEHDPNYEALYSQLECSRIASHAAHMNKQGLQQLTQILHSSPIRTIFRHSAEKLHAVSRSSTPESRKTERDRIRSLLTAVQTFVDRRRRNQWSNGYIKFLIADWPSRADDHSRDQQMVRLHEEIRTQMDQLKQYENVVQPSIPRAISYHLPSSWIVKPSGSSYRDSEPGKIAYAANSSKIDYVQFLEFISGGVEEIHRMA